MRVGLKCRVIDTSASIEKPMNFRPRLYENADPGQLGNPLSQPTSQPGSTRKGGSGQPESVNLKIRACSFIYALSFYFDVITTRI